MAGPIFELSRTTLAPGVGMMREISGQAAMDFLDQQITGHRDRIAQALAPFDQGSTFYAWLDTVRAIEEFINLSLFALEDDEALEKAIVSFRLDVPELDQTALASIRSSLITRFGESVAQRFVLTLVQAAAMYLAFRRHGIVDAASGLQTVQHAIGYFQSRRRHLLALLYSVPSACRGTRTTARLDSLNLFLPLVEFHGIALTGLHQQLMLAKVFPDYRLVVDDRGFAANHHFEPLDPSFLEPERAGITEMDAAQSSPEILLTLEPVDSHLIFSAAELRNDIRLTQAAYAEFGLATSDFAPVASLVAQLLGFRKDDYLVELATDRFEELAKGVGLKGSVRRLLVHRGEDYVANTNAFAPLITVGGLCVSTMPLLTRFLYYWKTVCLNRMRRFQIRSGFIFEDTVKEALGKQGFTVTSIRRINRKEFDVVAVRGQVIYNIQCKNNLVDLSRLESDTTRFARYNRQLDRYYARALAKEDSREEALKGELGLNRVQSVVISRFPVATSNPRILPFSHIASFRAKFSDESPDA
jgi:muconolactone delta-isomerase